jgi:hypothetical protein
LPEQQDQREAAGQHEGAAFDRRGNEPGPPALEARPGHAAVLDREQPEQGQVDRQRLEDRFDHAVVDVPGHAEAGDERDGVQERRQEERVTDAAVKQGQDAGHGAPLLTGIPGITSTGDHYDHRCPGHDGHGR